MWHEPIFITIETYELLYCHGPYTHEPHTHGREVSSGHYSSIILEFGSISHIHSSYPNLFYGSLMIFGDSICVVFSSIGVIFTHSPSSLPWFIWVVTTLMSLYYSLALHFDTTFVFSIVHILVIPSTSNILLSLGVGTWFICLGYSTNLHLVAPLGESISS